MLKISRPAGRIKTDTDPTTSLVISSHIARRRPHPSPRPYLFATTEAHRDTFFPLRVSFSTQHPAIGASRWPRSGIQGAGRKEAAAPSWFGVEPYQQCGGDCLSAALASSQGGGGQARVASPPAMVRPGIGHVGRRRVELAAATVEATGRRRPLLQR
jgi:hypothetical protein